MLVHHLEIIEANLNSGAPAVYQHMLDELEEVNLYPVFSSKLMSVFTRDLAECYPKTQQIIFDAFLLDGEQVIFVLLN